MKLPVGTKCGWTGSNKKGTVIAYFEATRAYDSGYGEPNNGPDTYAVLDLEEGFWGLNGEEKTPFVTMMIVHTDNLTNIWNDVEDRWSYYTDERYDDGY